MKCTTRVNFCFSLCYLKWSRLTFRLRMKRLQRSKCYSLVAWHGGDILGWALSTGAINLNQPLSLWPTLLCLFSPSLPPLSNSTPPVVSLPPLLFPLSVISPCSTCLYPWATSARRTAAPPRGRSRHWPRSASTCIFNVKFFTVSVHI